MNQKAIFFKATYFSLKLTQMYMQHLQPQTQNYVNEDSKRIIDKFQTLRSSNQHFKSQSDVKYQSSNQADHQGMQPKPKASDIQGQTTAIQAVLKKQGIQQKPATIPNNQIYQMTGAPTSQRNYLQVGKIDLESILSTNKKQGQVSQAQNYNPPQGIVTQREVNKRQTLPPDRRSFQDQFNTTPQCINNSNLVYNQQQQQPVKQVINSNYNLNSCQSSSTVSKVGSNGLINQNQSAFYQHQQQPSINIIQTSNFQNNSSSSQQYDDLDKYKKQMQQKLVSTTPSKQLLHSYQNQPQTSMHTPKGNNRSQHTSEANILYFKGNVSSQDLVSNQQSRIQSDSQLNLHPSPMKQISTHPNKIIGNDSFQQINQSQNQTFKNLIQNPESQSYLNNSSYKYQKQPASFDNNDFKKQYQQQQQQQQSQQFNNQQNSGQNLLNVKNTQFQYVDQSQALNKNNSNSTSIHNLPNSPQSAGMPGLSKGQQYYSQVNSVNPSIQNSQAFSQNNCSSNNNNFSNNNTNEKFSYTNTNILNSKTQSIDDILKHLKSKEMSKVQTIPQRIFNSTAQSLSNKSQLINQIGTNKEQLTNYQLTTTTPKEQEIKNELPLNNQIQITSINTITQNEKKVEVKPAVMRQNSDKLQNALTNRTDLFQMSSQNIQNPQNVNTACFNNIFSSSTNDYFFNKMNRNNNDSQKTVISSSINSSELIQPKVSQSGANSLTQQISTQLLLTNYLTYYYFYYYLFVN